MKDGKGIYLGKGGRIHGPFTAAEFEQLGATGGIDRYSWMWDHASRGWKPLDPPPPSLDASSASAAGGTGEARVAPSALEVLCLTRVSVLSGELGAVTETGCELTAAASARSTTPALPRGATIVLNLLDRASGRSMNVHAKVASVRRSREGWVYRFLWERCPELLYQSAGSYAAV